MRIWLLTLLCLTVTVSAAQLAPVETIAHKTTMSTWQHVISGSKGCSATAVGPHAILTASHCEAPTDNIQISGYKDNKIAILSKIRDGYDHTIYLLTGVEFKEYATVSSTDAVYGESAFMFGNPRDWNDLLRRGYVAGYEPSLAVTRILFSFQIDHGDSGAAIFNSKGHIVGVVSQIAPDADDSPGIALAASFPLRFTPRELARARQF